MWLIGQFERILIKERTMAGLKAAKAMGKKGGRPQALEAEDLRDAKALLRNKKITVKEVAKRLKVDPSTLYRYLPGGRSSVQEDSTSIE